jgi:hypothetical protein
MQSPLDVPLAAVVVAAGLAFAHYDHADRQKTPQAQPRSDTEVAQKLIVHGYQSREIEVDDKTCELEATKLARAGLEGTVHPATRKLARPSLLCCRPCLFGRPNVPQAQWLSPSEITQKLAIQGYQVHEIEVDDGAYEFQATNSSGARIEAHAHPATGEVLPRDLFCCNRCLEV